MPRQVWLPLLAFLLLLGFNVGMIGHSIRQGERAAEIAARVSVLERRCAWTPDIQSGVLRGEYGRIAPRR
jgi:hypothetical protein